MFSLKNAYKKTSVSAKLENTIKQVSEVYRCTIILLNIYAIYHK
ncbi:hypothetical protein FHS14_000551 [Paenibacillus baekrokdamisoli]|nr:hypothetical protein [Paenibacillus baekrokdamisoli]